MKRLFCTIPAGLRHKEVMSLPLMPQGGFNGNGAYEISNVGSVKVLDLDPQRPDHGDPATPSLP